STSLELGIDIGYIDLVVQIGSPKSVAKGLQRIGRAGHAYGETATGRMIAFEPWDLMECATLAKAAYDARIDRVEIPQNPLDVLAQAMVAMSLEKRWDIDEAFVEYLSPTDIFVLGGRTYQFVRARGTSVYVKDASGRRPTVPSWTGEMLPRSFDLSIAVGEFRRDLAAKIAKDGEASAKEWLKEEYRTDAGSAQSLVSYVQEQKALIPVLPTDRQVLLEGYVDVKGNRNVIFHFPFRRRVNDALSRAYAFAITEAHRTNVRVSVTDDNFMFTVPKRIELEGLTKLVTSKTLEDLLRSAILNTKLFKQRFRHCATRSFMILRNYK